MIITLLKGGLGNQLFQYSLGRHLALKHKTELKLDTQWFEKSPTRQYELDNFNISAEIAIPSEVYDLKDRSSVKFKDLFKEYDQKTHIEEQLPQFDPKILKAGRNTYLAGYWQTEKYFKKIEDIIKNDLTVKTEPDEKNRELLDQIKNCNAVAVHIRRGDYVTNPQTESILGSCSLNYYRKCADIIAKRIHDPHFFVFSDDPKWAIENIKIDFPVIYISHNGPNKGYEDLRLMSNCNHFIIANSSFSWWGAWLSRNLDKIVLAPKRWFKKEDINTKDLIPEGWLRI